mmetsp:Transcript_51510/g.115890  ORF Transcript_51510/g.115890 Transcript_51510/m.115890 type:complete len:235 (+) Transcript_51510:778-1482(+)
MSASTLSTSIASFFISSMASDASAESMLSIVQDIMVIKQTKKSRNADESITIGAAIADQSSDVVSWNRVKNDVGMSANMAVTCSESTGSSVSTMRPCPISDVRTIASTKQRVNMTDKIQTKVDTIPIRSLTQSYRELCMRKTRRHRSSRVNIMQRTRTRFSGAPNGGSGPPRSISRGTASGCELSERGDSHDTHRSMAPRHRTRRSNIIHRRWFPIQSRTLGPTATRRIANSAM